VAEKLQSQEAEVEASPQMKERLKQKKIKVVPKPKKT